MPTAVDDVITITTAEQLAALAKNVNGGKTYNGVTIKLGADLDLNGHNWTPISNYNNQFQGTFDGDNHTISNLTITGTNDYVGLFGCVGTGGTVQNVKLTNATVNGYDYVGGVVGENYGTVSSCTVSGKVNGSWGVGGLIGQNYGTIIGNTVDNISVTATGNDAWVGGLAAYNEYGTVSGNTVINSTITATNNGGVKGGLVGFTDIGTITDNIVDVKITVGTSTKVGGLVGTNQGGTVNGNTTVSEITAGNNSYVGSVVGYENMNSSNVKNNFFHSTANDVVGYFDYSGGNENITDNNPLFVVTLPGGVTASGDTCFTVDGIAYAVGNITLAAKLGYVYSGTTSAEITADIDLSNLGNATLDPANHYAFKDGDGYTFATADNVATNNYPELTRVYELTLPSGVTVSGDKVVNVDGTTYAVGEVTLTATGYTSTVTVDADHTDFTNVVKFNKAGTGVEVGSTEGNFSTNSGVYSITASQQNSTLTGNAKNNTVILEGGGENILTGGVGNDAYKFGAGGGVVTDFGIGATKDSLGAALSTPLGTDVIKIEGTVSGVYFDRAATSKKSATFTAVVTYDSNGDSTADEIIVLKDIAKKPTKYGSNPIFQTNDVAAATLKIWDTSGSKQAVLSASKLKKLFKDDDALASDLSETLQTQLVKLDSIGNLNLPAVDQLKQTAQAAFSGGDTGNNNG